MRFMVYNIRYGTGTGWRYHVPLPFGGYLRDTHRNMRRIIDLCRTERLDIIGLIEVDNGSYRTRKLSQAELIARELRFTHVYESKYHSRSLAQRVPIMREQGNAILTNQSIAARGFHYFTEGVKRLVMELEFDDFVVFLVHLSLKYRHRQYQLGQLLNLFRKASKPVFVAGDFNVFWGDRELDLFLAATGLCNANRDALPTFPSLMPRRQLDFILHSPEIRVRNFHIPNVKYSDHMPLVCDFDL